MCVGPGSKYWIVTGFEQFPHKICLSVRSYISSVRQKVSENHWRFKICVTEVIILGTIYQSLFFFSAIYSTLTVRIFDHPNYCDSCYNQYPVWSVLVAYYYLFVTILVGIAQLNIISIEASLKWMMISNFKLFIYIYIFRQNLNYIRYLIYMYLYLIYLELRHGQYNQYSISTVQ